jgi:hypothetical protein
MIAFEINFSPQIAEKEREGFKHFLGKYGYDNNLTSG